MRQLLGVCLVLTVLAACSPLRPHTHSHTDSRYSGVEEGFPPRAIGASNINHLARTGALFLTNDTSLTDPAVKAALGARYSYLGIRQETPKGEAASDKTVATYFSHSNNVTVEVTVEDDWVTNIERILAGEYQPPLGPDEVEAAIELAKDWMRANGHSSYARLEGFTILAFPPEGEIFYDSRVAFVSFHKHVDARPEFIAWVDLTKQTILKAQEDKL